jgi:flagellar export protein FliJ
MKKFVFSLQSWYDMQLSIEKQHKLQIGMIEAKIMACRDELATLDRGFDKTKNEYSGEVSRGMAVHRAGHYGCFFDSTKAAMAATMEQIGKLEEEKDQWMQKLVLVRRDIKLLDKLRESQYSEYLAKVKKHQDKFVDDLVSYKVSIS